MPGRLAAQRVADIPCIADAKVLRSANLGAGQAHDRLEFGDCDGGRSLQRALAAEGDAGLRGNARRLLDEPLVLDDGALAARRLRVVLLVLDPALVDAASVQLDLRDGLRV